MKDKKIIKSIESLEKQKQKHKEKIESYDGKNYALIDYRKQNKRNFVFCPVKSFTGTKISQYWEKEVDRFDNKIKELKERLDKNKNGCR